MKDLIIGFASNYTYDQVKHWINSIKYSGFTGDIVLCATNIKNEDLEKIAEKGVSLCLYGKKTETGYTNPSGFAPHVERFFYIWNYLKMTEERYRYVITTDTRDVVFQTNPSATLHQYLGDGGSQGFYNFVALDEGLEYQDEPWGKMNYEQCFGPFFFQETSDTIIKNVGVIAGLHDYVRDMMLLIFQMSLNRPVSIVDQAVYNFILNTRWVQHDGYYAPNGGDWGVNLGTTVHAVKAGGGDLGQMCVRDETLMANYLENYIYEQPVIQDGKVLSYNGGETCVVHQYDRVPGLKELIMERFND